MNDDHDQLSLIPPADYYHHEIISNTQFLPPHEQPGAGAAEKVKARRRRRKSKGGGGGEGSMRKRKLSDEQLSMLERSFGNEHKLETERKDRLAAELGLDPRQVAVWFQNRRARWKTKKLEEEYSNLKSQHESAVLDKCRLQAQVLKMKEQLNEAENEIRRLSELGFTSNSPSSSLSIDTHTNVVVEPHFDQFGSGLGGFFYVPPETDDSHAAFQWDAYAHIFNIYP